MERRKIFVSRVAHVLQQNGMTQSDLADRLGVSRSFISDVMNGNRMLAEDKALQACQMLSIHPDFYYVAKGEIPPDIMSSLNDDDLMIAIGNMRNY